MSVRSYLALLRRHWPVLVVCCILGAVVSGLISLRSTAQYAATAEVFVSTQTAATPNDLNAGTSFSQQIVASYARVATQPYVLNGVVEQLRLRTTAQELAGRVAVEAAQNSVLLTITATDPSPSRAAAIANSVAEQLGRAAVTLNPQTTDLNSQVKVTTTSPAVAPDVPEGSGLVFQVLLGVLGGLVVGIGVAALRHALDTRIRGVADVESLTRRPVLGALAYDGASTRAPLVLQKRPDGAAAEAFRTLRSTVQALREDSGVRSIVITSAEEGEGKTTLAANLAIALAANGLRTVVVDADLRRPRLAQTFGLESGVGLTDVLAGAVPLESAVQPWGGHDLHVLPAGRPASNANELLQTRSMADVLDHLTIEYDLVLFDTPPVLPVSDAAVLARHASGAILVSASGRATKPRLQRARTVLDQMNVRLLGVVVTMLPANTLQRTDGYRSAAGARYVRAAEPEPVR